jgi:hypothetical protein
MSPCTDSGLFLIVFKCPFLVIFISRSLFCFAQQSWDLVQQTQNYLKLLLFIMNRDGKSLLVSQACEVLAGKGDPLCEPPKETFWAGFYLEYAKSLKTHLLHKLSELGTMLRTMEGEESKVPYAVL